MFLMRTAFWLSLAILILPTDASEQRQFTETASSAVYKLNTFCDRNTQFCDNSSRYWAVFKQKAAYGAELAGELYGEYVRGESRKNSRESGGRATARPARSSRGTLRADDLLPTWRGNRHGSGI